MWKRLLRFGFRLLYNELAWTYDAVAWCVSLGQWKAWGRTSLKHLRPRGGRVLELAHGPGHLLIALRQAGFRPVGVDRSRFMGRQAARRLRRSKVAAPLVCCQAQALPFRSGSFDDAVATFPTEYILDPLTLREVTRVTDRAGRLVIVAAASLGGRAALPRLIDQLYKVTGQSAPMPEGHESVFQQAGLTTQVVFETVGKSTVTLVVVEKAQSQER